MISEPTHLDMRVAEGRGERATVITLRGDLDLASAEPLREALLRHVADGAVVLELSGLDFCDSAGLRTLVEAERSARSHGRALRLCALSSAVDRVLELAGARTVFAVFPDTDAALRGH